MRDRQYRRNQRKRTIEKCKKVLENSRFQGGTLYDRHIEKINDNGFGYMSKHGTMKHYILGNGNPSYNVRDRNAYSGTENWNIRDKKQFDSMDNSEQEYEEQMDKEH